MSFKTEANLVNKMEYCWNLWVDEKNQKNCFVKQKLCFKFAPA